MLIMGFNVAELVSTASLTPGALDPDFHAFACRRTGKIKTLSTSAVPVLINLNQDYINRAPGRWALLGSGESNRGRILAAFKCSWSAGRTFIYGWYVLMFFKGQTLITTNNYITRIQDLWPPAFVGGPAREQEVDVDGEALAVAVRAVFGLPHRRHLLRQLRKHHRTRRAEVQPRACASTVLFCADMLT